MVLSDCDTGRKGRGQPHLSGFLWLCSHPEPQNLNRKHFAPRGKQAAPFGDHQDTLTKCFLKFSTAKCGWVFDAMPGAKAIGRDESKWVSLMTSTGTRRPGGAYVGRAVVVGTHMLCHTSTYRHLKFYEWRHLGWPRVPVQKPCSQQSGRPYLRAELLYPSFTSAENEIKTMCWFCRRCLYN